MFHILNTGGLLLVDDNIGFGLLARPWRRISSQNMSYSIVFNVSEDICDAPTSISTPLYILIGQNLIDCLFSQVQCATIYLLAHILPASV